MKGSVKKVWSFRLQQLKCDEMTLQKQLQLLFIIQSGAKYEGVFC